MNFRLATVVIIATILLSTSFALAHLDGEAGHHGKTASDWEILGLTNPLTVMLYGGLLSGLAILVGTFFKNQMPEWAKHLTFVIIAVPILMVTVYMAYSTVLLNVESDTGGPVHWHADFEIWACGEKINLQDPTGLTNKIGEPLLHEHGDNRMHIEGVVLRNEQVSMSAFFTSVGGGI